MKVRTGHASLQFTDKGPQKEADIERIFAHAVKRRWAWITGTEAGPGAGIMGRELMQTGREAGYRLWVPSVEAEGIAAFTDCWIAVREDLIDGGYREGYDHVFDGSGQMRDDMHIPKDKHWGPKGLVHVEFDSELLGEVHIGSIHNVTGGTDPDSPFWDLNKKLAKKSLEWARKEARGNAIAFLNGDFNMDDSRNQKPEGGLHLDPEFVSLADELKKWRKTAPFGVADAMLSFSKDKRVTGQDFRVLTDRELPLHMDHYLLEGTYQVEPLKK